MGVSYFEFLYLGYAFEGNTSLKTFSHNGILLLRDVCVEKVQIKQE